MTWVQKTTNKQTKTKQKKSTTGRWRGVSKRRVTHKAGSVLGLCGIRRQARSGTAWASSAMVISSAFRQVYTHLTTHEAKANAIHTCHHYQLVAALLHWSPLQGQNVKDHTPKMTAILERTMSLFHRIPRYFNLIVRKRLRAETHMTQGAFAIFLCSPLQGYTNQSQITRCALAIWEHQHMLRKSTWLSGTCYLLDFNCQLHKICSILRICQRL